MHKHVYEIVNCLTAARGYAQVLVEDSPNDPAAPATRRLLEQIEQIKPEFVSAVHPTPPA